MSLLDLLPDELLRTILFHPLLIDTLCSEGHICGMDIRLVCKRIKRLTMAQASFGSPPVLMVSRMLIPDPTGDTATLTFEGSHPFRCRAHLPRCTIPSPYHTAITAQAMLTRPYRFGTLRILKADSRHRTLYSIPRPLGVGPPSIPIHGMDTGRRRVHLCPTSTVTFFSPRRNPQQSQRRLMGVGARPAYPQTDIKVSNMFMRFTEEEEEVRLFRH